MDWEDFEEVAAALAGHCREEKAWLVASVLRRFQGLQSLSEAVLTQVAAEVQLQTYQAGEMVCRPGESAQALYLVLTGTLAISVPGEAGISCQVGKLMPGMSFGGRENETVTACGDVSLCVVQKTTYGVVLKAISAQQIAEKAAFLHTVPLFSKLSKQGLAKLAHFFTFSAHIRGDCLYKEGDSPIGVYLIVSGEVEIVKNHSISEKEGVNIETLIGPRATNRNPPPIRRLLSRKNKTRRETSRLCVKGVREMVGDLEVIADTLRGSSAFVRSQHAEMVFITKADFGRRLQNPEIWMKIQSLQEVKRDWMQGRMQGLEGTEGSEQVVSRAKSAPRAVTSRAVKTVSSPMYSPKPVDDMEPPSYFLFPTEVHPQAKTTPVEFTNAFLRQISASKQGSKVLIHRNRARPSPRHSPPPNFHALPSAQVVSRYRELKTMYTPKDRLGSYDAEQLRKQKEIEFSQAKAQKSLSPSKHNLFRVVRSRGDLKGL